MKKKTNEEYINDFLKIHGQKYDYSKFDMDKKDEKGRCCFICPKHGEFWQTLNNHLRGHGCFKCSKEVVKEKKRKTIVEDVLKNNQNDLDLANIVKNYRGWKEKITVKCNVCGNSWETTPSLLKQGYGCPFCKKEKLKKLQENKKLRTKESLKEEIEKIHGKESFDLTNLIENYEGSDIKTKIFCNQCRQWFETTAHRLKKGNGCPNCKRSHLEKDVEHYLTEQNIHFEKQKHFEWLGKQSLDFYLPQFNCAIECQGEQHFHPMKFLGGEEKFKSNKEHDRKKLALCEENSLKLFYFSTPKITKEHKTFLGNNVFSDIGGLMSEIKDIYRQ